MKLKKASMFTKLAVLALVIYATVTLVSMRGKIEAAQAVRDDLQQQINDLAVSNAELEYDIEHSTDPDTIEDIAREKLGLTMPGEKVFLDTEGN